MRLFVIASKASFVFNNVGSSTVYMVFSSFKKVETLLAPLFSLIEISHIFNHLLIWNQFAPLAVFRLICTKSSLDNHIIFDNAIALQFIHLLNQAIKRLFVCSYRHKNHYFVPLFRKCYQG